MAKAPAPPRPNPPTITETEKLYGRLRKDETVSQIKSRNLIAADSSEYTYRIEKNGFDFALIEKREGTSKNVEKRLPYSFLMECSSVNILENIHKGIICETPEELRKKFAQDIVNFISENLKAETPTLSLVEELEERVKNLILHIVTELRPNAVTPDFGVTSGSSS